MNPTSVDAAAAVQSKLHPGHKLLAALEAGLVQDWIRTNRLLVLVEHAGESALLVYSFVKDLSDDSRVECIVILDSDFKFEIDSSNAKQVTTDVFLKISRNKVQLLFEILPGFKSNKFIDELVKARDVSNKRRVPPDFSWTSAYKVKDMMESLVHQQPTDTGDGAPLGKPGEHARRPGESDRSELSPSSPDLRVHRSTIATGGATPIAARDSVVRYQMARREANYTDLKDMRIFLGTYNVNGQAPTSGLADWLAVDDEPADIYAVGFQELDLSKKAFLFNETPREDEWLRAVLRALHPKAKYRKVKLVRLVGIMLIVFIQEKHFAYVRGIAAEFVGTGLMGKLGNKGGVAIRMELYNSSMCFVNSHLAAHVEEVERRNQDYSDICNRLVFSSTFPVKCVKDHDVIFWLGDLNYRLSSDLDLNRVKELLDQENFGELLRYDQFASQYAARKIFVGYQEAPIRFRPSYKYDPGTDNWDTSEKNRAPAWCDRVLCKGDNITMRQYRSHPSLRMSDHKPVSAVVDCGIKVIDTIRYRKIYEEVMKKLDKLENEFLPQVSVDTTEIVLGKIHFNQPASRALTVANTGQVPVQFEFIKKHRDTSYCKPWLTVEPYTGFLMPGENTYVTLEVVVDKRTAWSLNSGIDNLYDILVLHLDGGKDIFITVSGKYEKSCFGCSIEALTQLHQPVSTVDDEVLFRLEAAAYLDGADGAGDAAERDSDHAVLAVPKELWFLLDELYRRGLDTPGLFEQPGCAAEIAAIRTTLDTSLPDNLPGSVHSVAEALLVFLETLKEPIIPFALTQRALDGYGSFQACKSVVNSSPLSHQHVLKHAVSFLREVLLHSSKNGLDAKTLVALFGSAFLRLPPPNYPLDKHTAANLSASQANLERKRSMFVHHFLVNDLDD